jgi:hypothetical protein
MKRRVSCKWQIRNRIVSRIWQLSKMSILSSSISHGAFEVRWGGVGRRMSVPVTRITRFWRDRHLWDPRHITRRICLKWWLHSENNILNYFSTQMLTQMNYLFKYEGQQQIKIFSQQSSLSIYWPANLTDWTGAHALVGCTFDAMHWRTFFNTLKVQ